jgi:FtsH-binding integral membrane protein
MEVLNNYNDFEKAESSEESIKTQLRLGFIRKVYGILSLQLVITVLFAALTAFDGIKMFLLGNLWLFYLSLIVSLFCGIGLICFPSLAREVPKNYILLGIWTFCEAYLVATVCSLYDFKIVMMAATLTAAITISLTIYAFTTKTDFTFMGGFLFCGVCLLIFFGIFAMFFNFMHTVYCIIGVLFYSVYLIYDTQLVLGKFGNEYEIDDYVIAAMMIYIDIIQIFLYILELLGKNR